MSDDDDTSNERISRTFPLFNSETGETVHVKITVEGHGDPFAARAAMGRFCEQFDSAFEAAQKVAFLMNTMGISKEEAEERVLPGMFGANHDEVCDDCKADAEKSAESILAGVTDEGFDQFLRGLNES